MSQDRKFENFGRMVWGMIEDVMLMPGDTAYATKDVTFPTKEDRSQRGSVKIFVVRDSELARFIDDKIATEWNVIGVRADSAKDNQ